MTCSASSRSPPSPPPHLLHQSELIAGAFFNTEETEFWAAGLRFSLHREIEFRKSDEERWGGVTKYEYASRFVRYLYFTCVLSFFSTFTVYVCPQICTSAFSTSCTGKTCSLSQVLSKLAHSLLSFFYCSFCRLKCSRLNSAVAYNSI